VGHHHPLHRRVHCLHRPRRRQGRDLDQCLPGRHLPRGGRPHRGVSRVADRWRPGRHARHRGGSGAAQRHQLGTRAGRA
jgi:hypothetical protein